MGYLTASVELEALTLCHVDLDDAAFVHGKYKASMRHGGQGIADRGETFFDGDTSGAGSFGHVRLHWAQEPSDDRSSDTLGTRLYFQVNW